MYRLKRPRVCTNRRIPMLVIVGRAIASWLRLINMNMRFGRLNEWMKHIRVPIILDKEICSLVWSNKTKKKKKIRFVHTFDVHFRHALMQTINENRKIKLFIEMHQRKKAQTKNSRNVFNLCDRIFAETSYSMQSTGAKLLMFERGACPVTIYVLDSYLENRIYLWRHNGSAQRLNENWFCCSRK